MPKSKTQQGQNLNVSARRREQAFSKNNKDIGKTQLIEMEIDTGENLPVAQSPYTLSLKAL